ncbi:MAG: regulator [Lutibacter sp.]|nr:MAG: regulator [Lutibacter sp.]
MKNKISYILQLLLILIFTLNCSTNSVELDSDNDGILDHEDNCPLIANPSQEDLNNNGIGDDCDDATENTTALSKCENGMAGIYPCSGYDLMGHISIEELGGTGAQGTDSWGWTDPTTSKEYAIVGTSTGTTFVDISDTQNLSIIGVLPTATVNSSWRDIKVYKNHAFIVSERASNYGMQVFDLTRLRTTQNIPISYTEDAHYTDFGSSHNVVINEDSGYAYVVGADTFSGGPNFVNIQNPINPIREGGFSGSGYAHDAQVVTYNGPDTDYTGHEIYVGSHEDKLVIIDVTNKATPFVISSINYSNTGYTHQGWFTDDLNYFIAGDELDEINFDLNTRTIVFDFTDLDNPILHTTYTGPTKAIDHNGYILGDIFYLANYSAGVRMIDISGIENGNLVEVGYFDTYPQHNNTTFNGAWNVYPYFKSGNIIISDLEGGLFIIRKNSI